MNSSTVLLNMLLNHTFIQVNQGSRNPFAHYLATIIVLGIGFVISAIYKSLKEEKNSEENLNKNAENKLEEKKSSEEPQIAIKSSVIPELKAENNTHQESHSER